MISFLLAFSFKAVSDTLRVLPNVKATLTQYNVLSSMTWMTDRIKVVAMLQLGFIVKEVQIRLDSPTPEDYN